MALARRRTRPAHEPSVAHRRRHPVGRARNGRRVPSRSTRQDSHMELQDFLDHVNSGAVIEGGSEAHKFMHAAAQEALRLVGDLNTGYRTPEEVRDLLARLTGKPVDESVAIFPPFYSEFGKNLTIGKNVFINIGCRFQGTGGMPIGDGGLIGHGSNLTALDHGIDPDRRADMVPAPIVIGRKVWLGAGVTV